MRFRKLSLAAVGIASLLAVSGGVSMTQAQQADMTYTATLAPLNSSVTGGEASGNVTFTIAGDQLTIDVTAKGVPPDMEHWQHFHGFAEGNKDATCPSASADTNGDGIIDLIETEPVAGTTMAPLSDDPVSMDIPTGTYPTADADGAYTYKKTVSLKAMQEAFAAQFPGQSLDLDRRVVFIHGVPSSTSLPDTVASLGDIPAQVTLPIACGELTHVEAAATPAATPGA
ncbi:MAG: hypothetical protein R2853_18735 [Thermomicrobiales bacterium]